MSIPKEPRQLMINLMYLVLTALLALNVSAEIINAFFALKKGIETSNTIVDNSNTAIKQQIDKQADAYKNPVNEKYRGSANNVIGIADGFVKYIKDINERMVKEAGGPDARFSDGRPVKFKDKDITTRMYINEGMGGKIEAEIKRVRQAMIDAIPEDKDKQTVVNSIALNVDAIAPDSKAKNWTEYKFKQMPVAAVMPFFTKLQADAKTSETAILNYLFNKIGGTDIKFDQFKVALAPKTGYVIKGEKFEADVYLAAFSSNPGTGISLSVNGSGLPMKEGVAKYSTTPTGIGKQKVKATATIKNPLTGEVKSVNSEFEYEVGERSVAVSADKMNVFYIGVDNPVSVSAAGVSSNSLKVDISGGGGQITKVNDNNYVVKVGAPGKCEIIATAQGLTAKKEFRVKRIPDPVARLGGKSDGSMGNGEMKAQSGVAAMLDNFDFDAKCNIQSFKLTRVPKRQDPISVDNASGRFEGRAQELINAAKPGDSYYFDEVKARCPGDQVGRKINPMVFTIR